MIFKQYLTEVSFIDGTTEFKSYRGYNKLITVNESSTTLNVVLDKEEVNFDSIVLSIVNRQEVTVNIKQVNNTLNSYVLYFNTNETFLKNDIIEIQYTALNDATSDLYSVDYENGILYLASTPNINLEVESDTYNLLCTGKQGYQLDSDDYTYNDTVLTINNYQPLNTYDTVYTIKEDVTNNYTTPLLTNIKINYINTSEEESL